MKDKIVLLIAGCFALVLSSCLGDGLNYEYQLSKDAQIYKFHLKTDSVPLLDSVKFSIDQIGTDGYGLIYNPDSMPFGTVISEKVICSMELRGASGIQVVQTALIDKEKTDTTEKSDTIWWNTQDSLDFSKPVWFIVYAQDVAIKKRYLAQINIHQVKPDSMVWEQYDVNMLPTQFTEQTVMSSADNSTYYMYAKMTSGDVELYTASVNNLKSWTKVPLTDFPSNAILNQMCKFGDYWTVSTADGKLYKTTTGTQWESLTTTPHIHAILGATPKLLSVIVKQGSDYFFAKSEDLNDWKLSTEQVRGDFSASGFARRSFNLMYENNILLVGGNKLSDGTVTNNVWLSSDGLTWALGNGNAKGFTPCQGASLTLYDDSYYLIGGIDAKGDAIKDIYISNNYGVVWNPIDSMKLLPTDFKARGYASVQTTEDNNLFIFGGKPNAGENQPCFNEIWRGRINRLIPNQSKNFNY